MRAVVFLNGVAEPPEVLRSSARGAELVVAADGGALHALGAGIVPDLIVGDLDSLGEARAQELQERGARLERHPAEKDKMDGHLAILAARERGATVLDLVCAAGGRLSALFAVPHILLACERLGLRASMVAAWGRAFVIESGSRAVIGGPRDSVSVFPLAGTVAGVTLEGFSYPLSDARLQMGDTLGFHNELTGSEGCVSVEKGALLVIHESEGYYD